MDKSTKMEKEYKKGLNRHYPQRWYTIASRHIKRWLTSLTVQKMQIKTTMIFHRIWLGWQIGRQEEEKRREKKKKKKCRQRWEEKWTHYTIGEIERWCDCYGKTLWRSRKKLKLELPCDAAILLLGIYPKELKAGFWRDICRPTFTAALFTIAKR